MSRLTYPQAGAGRSKIPTAESTIYQKRLNLTNVRATEK